MGKTRSLLLPGGRLQRKTGTIYLKRYHQLPTDLGQIKTRNTRHCQRKVNVAANKPGISCVA